MLREGMIPHNLKKIFIFLILLPLCLLLTLQCGLNSYPYLYPPAVLRFNPDIATVTNRDDYDPDVFQGYELYYKFYDYNDATSQIIADDKIIMSVDEPKPEDVAARGYRRVNTVSDSDQMTRYPMIPINYGNRDSSFDLRIDFTGATNNTGVNPGDNGAIPSVTYLANPPVFLYRTVLDPEDTNGKKYKSFGNISKAEDNDILYDRVTLSMYIFAYGKYDKVYNIYSKPELLGSIDYNAAP